MLMKIQWQVCLAAIAACVMATPASSAVLVNDTWRDSTRTDPAPPTYSENGVDSDSDGDLESAWFTSNAAGMTAAPGNLSQATVTGSTSWTTYFTPEATPVTLANAGDSLEVRWEFSMQGVANDGTNNTGQNFRMAVVDSSAAGRVATDQAPGTADYTGYSMFMNIDQTLRRNTPFELKKRSTVNGAILSASAAWSTSLSDDGSTGDAGYASGTPYAYTMTITRDGLGGLDIVSRMEGAGLGPGGIGFLQAAANDASPASYLFDTFSVRPSASATTATSFDASLFRVTFTPGAPVPEPASAVLMGSAALAVVALRRRR